MVERSHIVEDSWLSGRLKRRVYHLSLNDEFVKSAKDGFFQRVADPKGFSPPVFIYSKVSPADVSHISFLERQGFHLVDTQVSFEKAVGLKYEMVEEERGPQIDIRFSVPGDETQTVDLARKNFIYSRFHADPVIHKDVADEIKAEWVRGFFLGQRGDQLVVALVNDPSDGHRIVGFVQLLRGPDGLSPDGVITIDLIATDRNYQRRGIAKKMIAFAESHCAGAARVRVGTQLSNLPSIRLYEGLGFKIFEVRHIFHYHRV